MRGAAHSVQRMSLLLPLGKLDSFLTLLFNLSIIFYRENALIIHYTRNDHLLRDGELVLIDAGGEYKCAAAAAYIKNFDTH